MHIRWLEVRVMWLSCNRYIVLWWWLAALRMWKSQNDSYWRLHRRGNLRQAKWTDLVFSCICNEPKRIIDSVNFVNKRTISIWRCSNAQPPKWSVKPLHKWLGSWRSRLNFRGQRIRKLQQKRNLWDVDGLKPIPFTNANQTCYRHLFVLWRTT